MSFKTPKPIKIIDMALQHAINRLKELQEQIVLHEKFGSQTVLYAGLYEAGNDQKNTRVNADLQKDYDEMMELAKELQAFRDKYYDQLFSGSLDSFINQTFKK